MCECINTIDAELDGQKIEVAIFWGPGNRLEARPHIALCRSDTNRRENRSGRAKVLAPKFCPFCGENYLAKTEDGSQPPVTSDGEGTLGEAKGPTEPKPSPPSNHTEESKP